MAKDNIGVSIVKYGVSMTKTFIEIAYEIEYIMLKIHWYRKDKKEK